VHPTDGATCRTCERPVHGTFCGGCGTPVDALPLPAPRPPDRPTGGGVPRPLLLAGAVVGAAVLLAAGGVALFAGGSEPDPSATTATAPVPAAPTDGSQTTASCERDGSVDGAGRATSYEPERAVDGDPTTAWRCAGDGVGQSLTVTFGSPVRIDRVGLIPGLAKTDPADGTDRYAQNRRIAAVRITTDAGHAAEARLDTSTGNRAVQTIGLAAPVVTRTITVSILSSVPGTPQNGLAAVDSVAIAEMTWG